MNRWSTPAILVQEWRAGVGWRIAELWREQLTLDAIEADAWRMFGYIVEQFHDERIIYQPEPPSPLHNLPRVPQFKPRPFNPRRYRK